MNQAAAVTFKPRTILAWIILLASLFSAGAGGRVESVYFKTKSPPPPFVFRDDVKPYADLFRAGLATLPESVAVTTSLSLGGQVAGLTAQDSTNLTALMSIAYSRIAEDPAFNGLRSALPYCFSTQKQTNGHYFLYSPEHIGPDPLVIVFLHGYGGNFQLFAWALKESLPDAIILCPSWNVSWYGGSPGYVAEAIADMKSRLHVVTTNLWLMGISAGGRAGFAVYPRLPEFRGFICLASAPQGVSELKPGAPVLMINGTKDPMAPIAYVRKQAELLKRRLTTFRFEELASDHFFILSQRTETFRLAQEFISQTVRSK
jgi:predicted esterase